MSSSSPCRALRSGKGVWKLRKQLRQPHRSSRRATTHSNPSSTVGSSPGVAEKRILGMFSLRTSDDRKADECVCVELELLADVCLRGPARPARLITLERSRL